MAIANRTSQTVRISRKKARIISLAEQVFNGCRLVPDGNDAFLPMSSTETIEENVSILLNDLLPLPYFGRETFFCGSEIHCRPTRAPTPFFVRGPWMTWKNNLTWAADHERAKVKVAEAWAGGYFDYLRGLKPALIRSFEHSVPEGVAPREEFSRLFARLFLGNALLVRCRETLLRQRVDLVDALVDEVKRF
ncbi:MAG: hypothetical protein JNK76_00710 [Planctomycetales bacterium]|nr:hypothetical protein [Planctomycetales bacterium]MBN8625700.1 hypothetical protein [Planctomycetota bacterium]